MSAKRVLVWDLPTRLCHWLMVIAISYAWFAVEILEDMQQHFWAGYSMLTLLIFRAAWGFVGSRYARFRNFFFSLSEVAAYSKTLPKKVTTKQKHYLGHNPVGSLSALIMLLVLIFQAATGLFSNDEYYFGPLSGLVSRGWSAELTELHHLNFNLVKAFIGLHIAAIVFYWFYKKDNLTAAMITGKKNAPTNSTDNTHEIKPRLWLAALILLLSAVLVYGLANAFSDTLPSVELYYY